MNGSRELNPGYVPVVKQKRKLRRLRAAEWMRQVEAGEESLFDALLEELSEVTTLGTACIRLGIDPTMVRAWIEEDSARSEKYQQVALAKRMFVIEKVRDHTLLEWINADIGQAFDGEGNVRPISEMPVALRRSIQQFSVETDAKTGKQRITGLRMVDRARAADTFGAWMGLRGTEKSSSGKEFADALLAEIDARRKAALNEAPEVRVITPGKN